LKYIIPLLVILLSIFFSFFSLTNALNVTSNYSPNADAMVKNSSGMQNTNFGADQNIGVINAMGQQIRSYIYFDLSSIPTGAKIYGAELILHLGVHVGSSEFLVGHVTSSWSETSITWNNQPSYTETGIKSQNAGSHATITSEVQSIVNGEHNYGWCLYSDPNYGAGFSGLFASKEYSDPTYRPILAVSYDTREQSKITLTFTPTLINPGSGEKTMISGRLTNFAGTSGIGGENIVINWNSLLESYDEEKGEISATTDFNGYYSVQFPGSTIPNGEYHFQAFFAGNDKYTESYSETSIFFPDAPTLFVVPEYALGGLMAIVACFAAVAAVPYAKKPLNLRAKI
jgi:hypothetical protein